MRQRRRLRRALITAAAGAACLAIATPAWADSIVPLHQTNVTAANFDQECDDQRFDSLPDGYDGWHFVLPGVEYGSFVSLSLTFTSGDGPEAISMSVADDAANDDYAFYSANDRVIHAYLFTPAGWTLNSGTAEITGTGEFFNLSHTCAGTAAPSTPTPTPTPTPTATPTPTPTSGDTTPGTPGTPSASSSAGGGLPVTGVAAGGIALVGLVLIGGGGALLFLRRRRDDVTFTA